MQTSSILGACSISYKRWCREVHVDEQVLLLQKVHAPLAKAGRQHAKMEGQVIWGLSGPHGAPWYQLALLVRLVQEAKRLQGCTLRRLLPVVVRHGDHVLGTVNAEFGYLLVELSVRIPLLDRYGAEAASGFYKSNNNKGPMPICSRTTAAWQYCRAWTCAWSSSSIAQALAPAQHPVVQMKSVVQMKNVCPNTHCLIKILFCLGRQLLF